MRNKRAKRKGFLIIPVIILLAVFAATSIHIIPTGYTGVKTSFGQIQEEAIRSGSVNFTIPFVEGIHKVNNKQHQHFQPGQVHGIFRDGQLKIYGVFGGIEHQGQF